MSQLTSSLTMLAPCSLFYYCLMNGKFFSSETVHFHTSGVFYIVGTQLNVEGLLVLYICGAHVVQICEDACLVILRNAML